MLKTYFYTSIYCKFNPHTADGNAYKRKYWPTGNKDNNNVTFLDTVSLVLLSFFFYL